MKRKLQNIDDKMSSLFYQVVEFGLSDKTFFSIEEAKAYAKYRMENTEDVITVVEIVRTPIAITK